ncbi:FeoA family protein [Chishuiella sp.]|uniref:FeoA family protein n=1 Tax=Chishuiella sp. TaxID=1969467 RepID=UPI0028AA0D07|nr:FeoA family protein [Chishuiella sp.]
MENLVKQFSLKDLNIGELAEITGYKTDDVPVKLYEMGFIPGTKLQIKNKAPFGGPICISITSNKTVMALRRTEADNILINKK